MNTSARCVKRFERSYGVDTAIYNNVPLPFYYMTTDGDFGQAHTW